MSNSINDCKRYGKYQLNLFLLATSFFTRLPVTRYTQYSPSKMRRASQYFPLVGWLIACILVIEFYLLQPLLGLLPSLCLLLISSILLTGALHEDGLADICDGIWGGYTKERKLSIMKDSRIGTYGTCALVLALLTKFVLWWQLAEQQQLILAICIAYPLSRAMAITLVQDMAYVSNQIADPNHEKNKFTGSKSEPLAKAMSDKTLFFVLATGVAATLILPLSTIFYLALGCVTLRYALKYWLNKHIDGYTGDALGTAQQLQELLIYIVLIANLVSTGAQS